MDKLVELFETIILLRDEIWEHDDYAGYGDALNEFLIEGYKCDEDPILETKFRISRAVIGSFACEILVLR